MHSLALQALLQSLEKQFRCPECGASPDPKHIEIESVKGDNMNVRITCQKCKLRSLLHIESNKSIQDIVDAQTAKELIDVTLEKPVQSLGDKDIKEIKNILDSSQNISDIL